MATPFSPTSKQLSRVNPKTTWHSIQTVTLTGCGVLHVQQISPLHLLIAPQAQPMLTKTLSLKICKMQVRQSQMQQLLGTNSVARSIPELYPYRALAFLEQIFLWRLPAQLLSPIGTTMWLTICLVDSHSAQAHQLFKALFITGMLVGSLSLDSFTIQTKSQSLLQRPQLQHFNSAVIKPLLQPYSIHHLVLNLWRLQRSTEESLWRDLALESLIQAEPRALNTIKALTLQESAR